MISNRALNNCIYQPNVRCTSISCTDTEVLWNMYQDMYTITFISKTASCEMHGVNKFLL